MTPSHAQYPFGDDTPDEDNTSNTKSEFEMDLKLERKINTGFSLLALTLMALGPFVSTAVSVTGGLLFVGCCIIDIGMELLAHLKGVEVTWESNMATVALIPTEDSEEEVAMLAAAMSLLFAGRDAFDIAAAVLRVMENPNFNAASGMLKSYLPPTPRMKRLPTKVTTNQGDYTMTSLKLVKFRGYDSDAPTREHTLFVNPEEVVGIVPSSLDGVSSIITNNGGLQVRGSTYETAVALGYAELN